MAVYSKTVFDAWMQQTLTRTIPYRIVNGMPPGSMALRGEAEQDAATKSGMYIMTHRLLFI